MNEQYLWDRSEPVDPELERLERSLAPLAMGQGRRRTRPAPRRRLVVALAAAAAVLLSAAGLLRLAAPPSPATSWKIVLPAGAAASRSTQLRSGQTLRTGAGAQLTVRDDAVGLVDLGPDSELRFSTGPKLTLRRGALHAYIWARPGKFVVDTPSARAVDLGCEYTLEVNGSGDGLLRVSMGWVAFQNSGRESFIPAGAACMTRPREGPGIPFYEDASEPFRRSVEAFEQGDSAALGAILDSARPRDRLTLWHLLSRVTERDRGRVFDRFAELAPLPTGVARDGAVRNDPRAMDLLWNALGLENTEWWRGWERKWSE